MVEAMTCVVPNLVVVVVMVVVMMVVGKGSGSEVW